MKKEDMAFLGQLLTSMKDAVDKLEKSYESGDVEGLSSAKKEIVRLQKRIREAI